jgi:hypothetical protein
VGAIEFSIPGCAGASVPRDSKERGKMVNEYVEWKW